ncbi:hypothetical protein FMN63_19430 [Stappia sp. BW2]|uniref:phosphatase domain-containing putative toxin n=1 Tax=Stappia sp. BW2 TaxID=2592622 RepID=UPI0011DE6BA7|nr:hypothetical protein [Stappia sp. BW2]TYC64651.1 hypothetical protein FMN63_19430 [Stappia sp. BW2]
MEKYPPDLRARLMEDDTSIRTVIACPGGGHIATLGFPGLAFDVQGNAYVDSERMAATLSSPALAACGLLIVLVEFGEVPEEAWGLLTQTAAARSIRIAHLPIKDYEAPDGAFMDHWTKIDPEIRALLTSGGTVALSCHYGAGRSGTVAASMLIERGLSPAEAIKTVRAGFADSIESEKQLLWLHGKERAA